MISKQILAWHYDTHRFHGKPPLHALLATLRDLIAHIVFILRPRLQALRFWAHKRFICYRSKLFPFIHAPGDGRGLRKVYVDGVERRRAVYANTLTGIVIHNGEKIELHPTRKGEVKTYKLRGKVTVEWLKP